MKRTLRLCLLPFFAFVTLAFANVAHALISAPSTDGDGSFMVYWNDTASATCGSTLAPAYEITQVKGSAKKIYPIADVEQQYMILTNLQPGRYYFELRVRSCHSSAPGGYVMALRGTSGITEVTLDAARPNNLQAPAYTSARGYLVTWDPLSAYEKRVGFGWLLSESEFSVGSSAPPVGRTVYSFAPEAESYFRPRPTAGKIYRMTLCKRKGSSGPCEAGSYASVYTEVVDDHVDVLELPVTDVGATPYSGEVDDKGNGAVTIPIKTLPGDTDLGPALSLSYNSSGADNHWNTSKPRGMLEYGWNISGFSEISRCRKGEPDEVVYDPNNGSYPDPLTRPRIRFDHTDSLCMDDQKLILVSGTHFRPNAVYRTEHESFKRITIKAVAGHEGQPLTQEIWFEVRQPDGRIAHYGNHSSARYRFFQNQTYPYLAWALNRVETAFGEHMSYYYFLPSSRSGSPVLDNQLNNYQQRDEENALRFVPNLITYPGGKVRFFIAPSHSQPRIEVQNQWGSAERTYYLRYGGLLEDQLESVQECGGWLEQSCLAPLEFRYSKYRHQPKNVLTRLNDGVGGGVGFQYSDIENQCFNSGPVLDETQLEDTEGEVYPEVEIFDVQEDVVLLGSNHLGAPVKLFKGKNGSDINCRGRQNQLTTEAIGTSVSRIIQGTGSNSRSWSYRYGDPGFKGANGRGFLGYATIRKIDDQSGITTYTRYRLKERVAGKVQAVYVYPAKLDRRLSDVDGNSYNGVKPLSITQYFHNVINIDYGNNRKTYFPYTERIVSQDFHVDKNNLTVHTPTSASIERHTYDWSARQIVAKNTTRITGYKLTQSDTRVAHPWGFYYPSEILASDTVSTVQTQESYRNFDTAADWRMQFVSARTTTHHNGVPGAAGVVAKAQTVTYSPWLNTFEVARETQFPDDPQLELITDYRYNTEGNLISSTVQGQGVPSRTTRFEGFDDGPVPGYTYNALGHVTTHGAWDQRYRRPQVTVDANGRRSLVSWDAFERPVYSEDNDGNVSTVEYLACDTAPCCNGAICNGSSNTAAQSSYVKITRSDVSPTVKEEFDNANRLLRTHVEGLTAGEWITTLIEYNAQGHVHRQSLPFEYGQAPQFQTFTYDQLGRKTQVQRPDTSKTQWFYGVEALSGKNTPYTLTVDTVLDAAGTFKKTRAKITYFDPLGQIILSKDGFASNAAYQSLAAMDASQVVTTRYRYDALGNPVWVQVDGGPNDKPTTTATFDAAGNRTELIGPNVGRVQSQFNALGQLTWTQDNAGNETTREYDLLGRLEWQIAGDDVVRYTYDEDGGLGQVASVMYNGDYQTDYTYENGRLTDVAQKMKGGYRTVTGTTHYSYDPQGRIDTQTYASGISVQNTYSDTGYLSEIRDADTQALLHRVDDVGPYGTTLMSFGNGMRTEHVYDPATGFIKNIKHLNAAGSAIHWQNYRWHSSGNLQERGYSRFNNSGTTHREEFDYDQHDRVLSAKVSLNGSVRRTLNTRYTPLGNITSKTSTLASDDQVTGYAYGTQESGCARAPGPHAVSKAVINGITNTLCYDNNGYLTRYTKSGADTFVEYNHQGQPIQITVGTALSDTNPTARDSFLYGPQGQRFYKRSEFKKGSAKQTEEVYYFDDGTEHTYYSGDYDYQQTQKTYASGNVLLTRRHNYISWEQKIQYLHKDNLGSIVAITDDTLTGGDAVHKAAFEPFGSRRSNDWSRQATLAETTAMLSRNGDSSTRGFTGHEHLDRTGFIHMNGRVYDPVLGRFLTPDPLVQAPTLSQSWNRYAYVWNNPLRNTDPSGYKTYDSNADYASAVARGAATVNEDNNVDASGDIFVVIKNGDIFVVNDKGQDVSETENGRKALSKAVDNVRNDKSKSQKWNNQARDRSMGGGAKKEWKRGNIEVRGKGRVSFDSEVEEVVDYAENAGETIFGDIAASGEKLIIQHTSGASRFGLHGKTPVVLWNPEEGLKLDGSSQSPALGLVHEIQHAHDFIFKRDMGGRSSEKRVIQGIETRVANFYGEGVRKNHSAGRTFQAQCVTCTFDDRR